MPVYPHSKLLLGKDKSLVITGSHIQVLDTATGDVLSVTTSLDGAEKDALAKSGPIRCIDVDEEFKYVATTGDDKVLKVWEVDGLKLLSQREVPKKPTEVHFTRDAQTIIVADKFGDVFSYPLHPEISTSPTMEKKDKAFSSHDNPAGGHLVLGHTSMLTTFTLTPDERYIISADRDEHIRVSWYPQGYNIERFCLGHQKYVSAIHILRFDASTLISGGGDPTLKVWDWLSGVLRFEVPISDVVMPYIKISAPKVQPGWDDEGDDSGKSKKKKGKKKGKAESGTPEPSATDDPAPVETALAKEDESHETTTVLAVQKIDTFEDPSSAKYIVFSVTGATAIFYSPYRESVSSSPIQAFDFGRPIVDFVLSRDTPGLVWVLLDPNFAQDPQTSADGDVVLVKILQWTGVEFSDIDSSETPSSGLLASLNSQRRISATQEQLTSLDIYSPLLVLPKNQQVEHDPMDREAAEYPDQDGTGTPGKGKGNLKALSAKELARLTRKQKLEEQLQARAVTQGSARDDAGRDPKKQRSDEEQGHDNMDIS